MDESLVDIMNSYYDERANEYELIYQGLGPAVIKDADCYKREARQASDLIRESVHGKVLDFACGTGFWIPSYVEKCIELTLIDQSKNMLQIANGKVGEVLPITSICKDIHSYEPQEGSFDSILAGFIFSHIEPGKELPVIRNLLKSLKEGGRLLFIDSAWSLSRQQRVSKKHGIQRRQLENGKSFSIYKRYFEKDDLVRIGSTLNCGVRILLDGDAFVVAILSNHPESSVIKETAVIRQAQ